MKKIVRWIINKSMSKHIVENNLKIDQIFLKASEVSYFNLSSNSIISFMYNGKHYYFRPCPSIKSEEKYFEYAIMGFFDTIGNLGIKKEHFLQEIPINTCFSEECVSGFFGYLERIMKKRYFLKKIRNTDLISEKLKFNIWNNHTYNEKFFEAFGLLELPEKLREIAIYFLWYMRAKAADYRNLKIVCGNQHSFFLGVKSISTRIVAEELKLEHLITTTKWCTLVIENKEAILGVLSEAAAGNRMYDKRMSATGALQRELLNLNVLDVICFQRDHGPNNYNVFVNEDNDYSICAFDNDHPYTFLPVPSVRGAMSSCTPLIDKKGMILRPYFDKNIELALEQLDVNKLKRRLEPYLNSIQIYALLYRIEKLRRAIDKTKRYREQFLLLDDEWNEETCQEEVNGKYGMTYLKKAILAK